MMRRLLPVLIVSCWLLLAGCSQVQTRWEDDLPADQVDTRILDSDDTKPTKTARSGLRARAEAVKAGRPTALDLDREEAGTSRGAELVGRKVPTKMSLVAFVPPFQSEVIYVKDYGSYTVWIDSFSRLPVLTAHLLKEHSYKNKTASRSFATDNTLPAELRVEHSDYDRKGYLPTGINNLDRGHMVPHNDADSESDERRTYMTTNIAPQQSGLNQGAWSWMEIEVRKMVSGQTANKDDRALILTGPIIFQEDTTWIPTETRRVLIPGGFFKVVLLLGQDSVVDNVYAEVWLQDTHDNRWRGTEYEDLKELEAVTGIKFLP